MNFFSKLYTTKRLLFASIAGLLIYPQINSKFNVYYSETQLNQLIYQKCQEINKGYFFPTLYLGYGWKQTIFGSRSRYKHDVLQHQKEYIDFGEYGDLAIDYAQLQDQSQITEKEKHKNDIIVILQGTTASRDEPYIVNITAEALKQGYKVILYNDRLYNNYEEKGRIFPEKGYYCMVEDVKKVMDYLQKKHSNANFYAIGHSFGANIMVKYLGQNQKNPFKAAVSVANPFDIQRTNELLYTVCDQYLVQSRQQVLKMREKLFQQLPHHFNHINLEKALQAKTSKEFDEIFQIKMHGISTVDEYYENLGCTEELKNVSIPLLCINSKDDPVLHHSTIPYDIVNTNQNIFFLVTNTGGHVCWFEGFFNPKRWYIKPTLEYLDVIGDHIK